MSNNTKSTRELCDAILDTLDERDMLLVFQYLLDLQKFNREADAYVPAPVEPPKTIKVKRGKTMIRPEFTINWDDDE